MSVNVQQYKHAERRASIAFVFALHWKFDRALALAGCAFGVGYNSQVVLRCNDAIWSTYRASSAACNLPSSLRKGFAGNACARIVLIQCPTGNIDFDRFLLVRADFNVGEQAPVLLRSVRRRRRASPNACSIRTIDPCAAPTTIRTAIGTC